MSIITNEFMSSNPTVNCVSTSTNTSNFPACPFLKRPRHSKVPTSYDSSPPVIKVQVMQLPEWENSITFAEKIRGGKDREMKMKKITSIASLLHLRFTRQTGIHSNKFCVNAVRFYSPPSSTKPPGKVSPLTNNYVNHWLKIQILRLYAW